MEVTLDPQSERLLGEGMREGRFESPEALVRAALEQFLLAQERGEAEANRLALLRKELHRADAGEFTECDDEGLASLFAEARAEVLRRLKARP